MPLSFSSFFTFLAVMIFPTAACGAHLYPESHYVRQWCGEHGGEVEVILPDKTRCDCVTATHAVEIDFAAKWYEAVGQSLYYGLQTGKKAGIVLIIETESDRKYWLRLNSTILHYDLPIDTWLTGEEEAPAVRPPMSAIRQLLLKNRE